MISQPEPISFITPCLKRVRAGVHGVPEVQNFHLAGLGVHGHLGTAAAAPPVVLQASPILAVPTPWLTRLAAQPLRTTTWGSQPR